MDCSIALFGTTPVLFPNPARNSVFVYDMANVHHCGYCGGIAIKRRLFCEISPLTYAISVMKCRLIRHLKNTFDRRRFAARGDGLFPTVIYRHNSLIRRQLGDVDMELQENKAVNLSIAAQKMHNVLIKPGETFSFWRFVGKCSKSRGYKEGLVLTKVGTSRGIGGGMCQFTNLIHWLVLHSPLDIVEHHHHDGSDLFPDYGRQVPFGCGTSILYNYLDYRVQNNTDYVFQLIFRVTDTHLCGELRSDQPAPYTYHVVELDPHFVKVGDDYFRRNQIYRKVIDKKTGNTVSAQLIKESDAKVLYPPEYINEKLVRMI